MVKANYDVLVRNGKERFVVIPEKEYQAMREKLQDEVDFKAIETSKKRNAGKPLVSHEEVMRKLGLAPGGRKRKAGKTAAHGRS